MKFRFVCVIAAVFGALLVSSGATAQDSAELAAKSEKAVDAPSSSSAHAQSAQVADPNYVIGAEDVIYVNVWHEPEVSRSVPVRSDGKISLPLIGELTAVGLTPQALQLDIQKKLKSFISAPDVTVIIEDLRSQHLNVLGSVAKPGVYHYAPPMTFLDAIALSGGVSDFAKTKKIYVIRHRQDGSTERIPVNYREALKGMDSAANLQLQPRDTVVVP